MRRLTSKSLAQFLIVIALSASSLQAQDANDLRGRIAALELRVIELEKQVSELLVSSAAMKAVLFPGADPFNFEISQHLKSVADSNVQSSASRPRLSWKGDGSKETESFAITGSEFRVRWTVAKPDGLIFIQVVDETGRSVGNAQGSKSDSTVVRAKPGRYYLKISSAVTGGWEVSVEQ